MLRNHLKFSVRNILREKYFSIINVVGLALGLAVCLLIWTYVRFELSFDNFHPDSDRIFRVDQTNIWSPKGGMMGSTGPNLALVLRDDYPEVEEAVRINTPGGYLVRYQKPNGDVMSFNEENVLAADSGFFNFFGFELKEGSSKTALHGLNKVVISEEISKKLFGDEPALGKSIEMIYGSARGEDRRNVEITGVTKTQPENSHFHFDYLISIYTNPNIKQFEWSFIWTQEATYVKLKEGSSASAMEKKMESMVDLYVKPIFGRLGIKYEDFMKGKDPWVFKLLPLKDIHLFSEGSNNRIGVTGDVKYVYIFSVVAGFVLLLAIINFVNLSTARSASRAKEVGVKKALGAMRNSLVVQFQVESILMALVATVMGLGLLELFRIVIINTVGMELTFSIWDEPGMLWLLPLIPIIVGMIAGAYPSFYLAKFRPAQVLKGKLAAGFKRSGMRNVLVLLQFTVSITFLVATIVVYNQLQFFMETDLGFDKENILIINNGEKLGESIYTVRDEILRLPGVTEASVSMTLPGRGSFEDIFIKEEGNEKLSISQNKVDEHYMKTMGMNLVAGRFFDLNRPSDVHAVIPNETTIRLFGWTPEEALGKYILYPGDDIIKCEIVGVVSDYHYASLHNEIAPAIFYHTQSKIWEVGKLISIKFQPQYLDQIIASVRSKWNQRINEAPFEYSILDQEWARQYREEQRLGGLFGIFAGLSILIAMIGLVGLVTYSAEQRKKEIGVRKVMGASVSQVVILLNKNFTWLVLISFLIATPLSWYAMREWLSQFPYQVPITINWFIISGVIMIGITWLTVSYQSIKAGMTNPVDVLKDE